MGLMDKFSRKKKDDDDTIEKVEDFEFAESVVDEEDKKKHQRRDFLNKYKLGNHHKIERFGMTVISGLVVLFLISGFSFIRNTSKQNVQATVTAKYTTDITYSLSQNKGVVDRVVRSEDGKSAYLLLKMEDVSNMSLDASTYTVYLTSTKGDLAFSPAGSFFIFGSTGYMGVMLHDDAGIPNQILDVTIRANVDVRSEAGSNTISDDVDGSFSKYDQARIYVNFGAEEAEVNKSLNDNDIEPSDLYYELVSHDLDKVLHEELDKAYDNLDRLNTRADEYINRIVSAGYVAPDEPEWLDDKFVVPGGIMLNHEKTLSDGYVNQVLSDYSQFSEFMVNKSKERSSETITSDALSVKELTSTTGGVINLDEISDGASTPTEVALKTDMSTLTTTWSSILTQKQVIQTDINRRLLLLEAEQRDQNTIFSLGDTDQLILW